MSSTSPKSHSQSLSTPKLAYESHKRSSTEAGFDQETGRGRQVRFESGPSPMRSGHGAAESARSDATATPSAADSASHKLRPPQLASSPGRNGVGLMTSAEGRSANDSGSEPDTEDDDPASGGQIRSSNPTYLRRDASGSGLRTAPAQLRAGDDDSGSEPDTENDEPLTTSAARQRNMLNGLSVIANGGTVAPSTTAASTSSGQPLQSSDSSHSLRATSRGSERLEDERGDSTGPKESTPVLDLTAADPQEDDIIVNLADSTSVSAQKQGKGKGKASAGVNSASTTNAAPEPEIESAPSLSTLSCPICLGAPTPLALTACGHAFCAPCLHTALIAGPSLTPPPPDLGPGTRGNRGGGAANLFVPQRGRGGRARGGVRTGTEPSATDGSAVEPPTELDKHCPVCRAPLRGGWGRSLRGLVLRMAPKRGTGNAQDDNDNRDEAADTHQAKRFAVG